MAATWMKALHIHKGKSIAQTITHGTDYAENPGKTNKGELVTGHQCDPRTAVAEFLLAKRQYKHITGRDQGKRDVLAYHIQQSFRPGEVTPRCSISRKRLRPCCSFRRTGSPSTGFWSRKPAQLLSGSTTYRIVFKPPRSRADINELQRHIGNYNRTRETWQRYKASGYSQAFPTQHEGGHYSPHAAKKAFDALGGEKLPSIKELQTSSPGCSPRSGIFIGITGRPGRICAPWPRPR